LSFSLLKKICPFSQVSYFKSEFSLNIYTKDVERIKDDDSARLITNTKGLIGKYLTVGAESEVNLSNDMRRAIEILVAEGEQRDKQNLLTALDAAQNDAVVIMALGAFPRFLTSHYYDSWRNEENDTDDVKISHRISVLDKTSTRLVVRNLTLLDQAIASFDRSIISTRAYGNEGQWLSLLLTSVECVPVMVSLSTASKDRPGFPLIYVNTAFEVTTGYLRKDIVGRNCRFLQRGKGEPEAVKLLADALRDAQPVKVPITNFRRDGTEFSNLLAMKPIFDENGEQFHHSICNMQY